MPRYNKRERPHAPANYKQIREAREAYEKELAEKCGEVSKNGHKLAPKPTPREHPSAARSRIGKRQ